MMEAQDTLVLGERSHRFSWSHDPECPIRWEAGVLLSTPVVMLEREEGGEIKIPKIVKM